MADLGESGVSEGPDLLRDLISIVFASNSDDPENLARFLVPRVAPLLGVEWKAAQVVLSEALEGGGRGDARAVDSGSLHVRLVRGACSGGLLEPRREELLEFLRGLLQVSPEGHRRVVTAALTGGDAAPTPEVAPNLVGGSDPECARLLQSVRRDPRHADAWWALLAALTRRRQALPDLAEDVRAGLLAAWRERAEDRRFSTTVMAAFGLEVAESEAEELPPAWWRDGARLEGGAGLWYDRVTALPLGVRRITDGAPMVLVPEGPFRRGRDDGPAIEGPARTLLLSSFYIDLTPVTGAQVDRYLEVADPRGDRASRSRLREELKVPALPEGHLWRDVSWGVAQGYAARVGARLPTEAQWEKAARGTDGRLFPWGNEPSTDPRRCVCEQETHYRSGTTNLDLLTLPNLALEGASPFGAWGMAGSVWEWVVDWGDPGYYASCPQRDPPGPAQGARRVLRGGCHSSTRKDCRVTNRFAQPPESRRPTFGFRLAVPVPG